MLCLFSAISAHADVGVFTNLVLGVAQIPLIVPASIEVGYGEDHSSVSVAYSRLETSLLTFVDDEFLGYSVVDTGTFLSLRSQYYTGESLMSGWLGEAGIHFVSLERLPRDAEGYGYRPFIKKKTVDGSLDVGYGHSFGDSTVRFNLAGLVGYRFQTLKTRKEPIDARMSLGIVW